MGYVKANFRIKAQDVQLGALGRNFQNFIAGSSINAQFGYHGGGFAMGSFAGSASGGVVQLSAVDALTNAFGLTYVSNVLGGGAGFKYLPFAYQDFSGDGVSGLVIYALSATQAMAGDDSIAIVTVKAEHISGPPALASVSVHFIHFGLIVSTPDAFR